MLIMKIKPFYKLYFVSNYWMVFKNLPENWKVCFVFQLADEFNATFVNGADLCGAAKKKAYYPAKG